MIELQNDSLHIKIAKKGAEIISLYDKRDGIEHIWQADPTVWPWHAPNLFPIVGGCKDNRILIDGQYFPLTRHGFARHSTFNILEASPLHAVFSFLYNDESLQVFPYKFEYQIIYDLEESQLRITYKVINLDDNAIYFSIGAHPAFAIPFFQHEQYSDYYLTFEYEEVLSSQLLDSDGLVTGQTRDILIEQGNLHLSPTLFENDALVFMNLRSKRIDIKSEKHQKSISIYFPSFKELGIWAKPYAHFICVEPWLGHADHASENPTAFQEKPGIQSLRHGHTFEADFVIAINLQ
ncbi:aldose 1-epimerase family protein [Olivibacter sitiensis]|uniref:aldose 1-epimerase family protein n=1 Tax=Olivibacter sitiensis TaxID=376470 RepID=UPI00040EADB2|nr:aldose 1-epimerase family protein [Olivibacter sitiensis]